LSCRVAISLVETINLDRRKLSDAVGLIYII
jgi:hypothetical protein